jgi:hypothetical protein
MSGQDLRSRSDKEIDAMSAENQTADVLAEHDRIQTIPDTPGWAENCVFQVHDAAAGHSVWCHWGRMPGAPEIWEAVIAVYLPGDGLLVSRSYGRSPADQAASSGPLSFRCEEPNRSWVASFDGMARAATTAETFTGPLREGTVERLQAELSFTGLHPTWSAHGAMDQQSWASAHLEQAGWVVGRLEIAGRRIEIDAFGFRDHSYGPRDYSRMLGDTWCTAVFPSGRAVLVIQVWQLDGPALIKGFVWDGTTMHEATDSQVPRLSGADGQPHEFELAITTNLGTERMQVAQQHCMAWTMAEPSALLPGATVSDPTIYCTEGPALISWDGETAAGWIEKTLRPGHFA